MPALTFLAAVGLVLVALLFVADATLESGSPPIVTSASYGLPNSSRSVSIQTLTAAPAPDVPSETVLATQPKIEPAARAARAEAQATKNRVIRERRPVEYQRPSSGDRFSIKGY